MGILGLIWAAVWTISYRQRLVGLQAQGVHPAQTPAQPLPFRSLLRSRFVWQFTVAKIFVDPVWYFYTFWFPQYLKTSGGFSLKAIGETAWIPFLAAGVGNLAGGYVGGKILRYFPSLNAARKATIIAFLALMGAGTLGASLASAQAALVLASLATFGYTAALANMLALPADRFPSHTVASVWGFASMGAGFGGMLFSLVTGVLVDRYSFAPVFALFGAIPAIACWLIAKLPDEDYS
jgi:ACS family hexuronate transporter-like MFS transporter